MSEIQNRHEEEEAGKKAMLLSSAGVFPMTLKSVLQLNIIDILYTATSSGAWLSPSEIAARIPTKNPDAPSLIDRILLYLASFDVISCSVSTNENGEIERAYGASPMCKFLTRKHADGVGSIAPLILLHQDEVFDKSWYRLSDVILEGGVPFDRAHGISEFEYTATDPRFNKLFNQGMSNCTTMVMKKMLEVYKGFDGINVLVDVGGGIGANLKMILSKHPHIKGINYDLPHVVAGASAHPGIEFVGGDMFVSVPKADAILMKWVLHDWSDEHCLKVLNNCCQALPSNGKVILVEFILPQTPEKDTNARIGFGQDLLLLAHNTGGKERSQKDFDALAKKSGFSGCEVKGSAYDHWVMELNKKA